MADSMMRLNRLCRTGSLTDFVLIAIFFVLAFVFIQRRGYMSKVDSLLENDDVQDQKRNVDVKKLDNGNHDNAYELIDERIKKVPDARSPECKDISYNAKQKVSIILDFFDYQFYDLKTTIGSILQFTPAELILEVLVLDIGSTLEYIKQDSKSFLDKLPTARLIRLPRKVNIGSARMEAARIATGEVLVFLDNNVICNAGWLEPLLKQLDRDPSSIAVPHFDNINDPVSYEYQSTASNVVSSFTWSLTIRMAQAPPSEYETKPVDLAVMRGNAFAVTVRFFEKIAGFDEGIEDASGQTLEFSFRSWMCGGSIKVVPCSRVGVLNLNAPVKVMYAETIRRISELWIGDKKELIYRNTGTKSAMGEAEVTSLQLRRKVVEKLGCNNFDWYLKTAARDIYTPSKEAKLYGLLKCRTGRCARIGDDQRVDLGQCKPKAYSIHTADMLFEYDTKGFLKTQGKCLETQSTAYIKLVECNEQESKQHWDYQSGGKLKNRWSGYCAMHVTDPDKKVPKGRQIMMAQECGLDTTGEFVGWDFIIP